jgi:hypothetical protein
MIQDQLVNISINNESKALKLRPKIWDNFLIFAVLMQLGKPASMKHLTEFTEYGKDREKDPDGGS